MPATVSPWRCEACGKWSHAQRRPKTHQRFIRGGEDVEPPAEFVSHEPESWNGDPDADGDPGGWWIACGPFAEYVATRVGA